MTDGHVMAEPDPHLIKGPFSRPLKAWPWTGGGRPLGVEYQYVLPVPAARPPSLDEKETCSARGAAESLGPYPIVKG